MSICDAFQPYDLTLDQQQLLEQLDAFFSSAQKCFVLKGYAGTGKTFMMEGVTRFLQAEERPFRLLAPTGRAAKVIAEKTKHTASTVHKAIYSMDDLKEYKVQDADGSETYKYYFDLRNNDDDARMVYIVDEASMVSNVYSEGEFFRFGSGHLLNDFFEYVNLDSNDHQKKILFIGDDAQLPPVGSKHSPALDVQELSRRGRCDVQSYELTEVVRQEEGSGILANATAIRDGIRSDKFNVLGIDTSHDDVSAIHVANLLDSYLTACDASSIRDTIIVAYTNSQVKDYNDLVRQHRFPDKPDVCAGDRVLVVQNSYRHEIPLLNGEFGEVVAVSADVERRTVPLNKPQEGKKVIVPVHLSFRDVVVRFPGSDGEEYDIECKIHDELLNSKERDLSSDEHKALYVDFKKRHAQLEAETPEFKEAIKNDPYFNCLQLKYGYAVTCHKAQGGEWAHVFVDFGSTMGCFTEAYFRWAYTAVTRAQCHLYGLNAPHYGVLTATEVQNVDLDQVAADVICVDGAAAEDVGVDMSGCPPFLSGLLGAVQERLGTSGIRVATVAHHQYCEHYSFTLGDKQATAMLDYTGKDRVSRVRWKPGGDADLKTQLSELLTPLKGKTIVVQQAGEAPPEAEIEMPAGVDYLREFLETIGKKMESIGVHIVEAKHPTPYLGRYVFHRDGHTACVDYTFKGSGLLSRVAPGPSGTTSESLLHEVMQFSQQANEA